MLAAAGGVFTWLMGMSLGRALDQGDWIKVPCRIVRSEVLQRQIGPDSPIEFGYGVTFSYRYEGKDYTAEKVSLRGTSWSQHAEPAKSWRERYPLDSEQECLVNPADPSVAVLEEDSKGPGYSLWFPLLFVLGGIVMMANAVRVFLRAPRSTGGDLHEKAALAGLAEGATEKKEGQGEIDDVEPEGPDKV